VRYFTMDEMRAKGREYLSHFTPDEQRDLLADPNDPRWRKLYLERRDAPRWRLCASCFL